MPGLLKFAVVFALATSVALAAAPRQIDVSEGPTAAAINSQLTETSETGFGGAVIVEVDGDTVSKAGYGYADRERKIPFTADTAAQIGSITKAFTALAVSQLTAEGKLDLNVPVRTYLPDGAEPMVLSIAVAVVEQVSGQEAQENISPPLLVPRG